MFCVPGSCADCWYPKDSQGASYSSTFLQRPVSGLWWTSTSVGLLQWDLGNTKSAQFLRAGGVSSGHCHFLLPGSQSASDDQCIQCCPSVPKMLVWWHDDMMTWWANFPVLLAPYFRIKSGFLQISKSLHTPSYSPTQSLAVYIGLHSVISVGSSNRATCIESCLPSALHLQRCCGRWRARRWRSWMRSVFFVQMGRFWGDRFHPNRSTCAILWFEYIEHIFKII